MQASLQKQPAASSSRLQGQQKGGTAARPFTASPHPPRVAARRSLAAASRSNSSYDNAVSTSAGDAIDSSTISSRRQLLSAATAASVLPALMAALPAPAAAEGAAVAVAEGFKALYDPILAYQFIYPTVTSAGQQLQMTLTHPPEKYSSAAPLTADARQRIVSEVFDLRRFVTVSMTVGPASGVLKEVPQDSWKPRDVALTVLIDRSTARLSSGQRTALNDIEEVHQEERDGQTYIVYEHTSQGSPTVSSPKPETFRHALAATTTRPGLDGTTYLYTLNLSCPQTLWSELSGPFQTAIDSFKLVPTTGDYIPPDQNPWLFF